MGTQTKSKVSPFLKWPYWSCGRPFVGVGIVYFYLAIFTIYRGWNVGAGYEPTDVVYLYFRILTGLWRNLGDPRSAEIYNAITTKYTVVWGYTTGLVALALVFAIVISGYVVFNAPRGWSRLQKWMLLGGVFLFSLVIYPFVSWKRDTFNHFTVIARQFWGLIRYQLTDQHGLWDIVNIELIIVGTGYAVSILLAFASAATLWPVRELEVPKSSLNTEAIDDAANDLSTKMKHLRLILYVGAILLVLISFRHKIILGWALEYLKPVNLLEKHPTYTYANIIFGHLETLTSNNVLATSVMNTLLLAALYVPSALLLQRRAGDLSKVAIKVEDESKKTALAKTYTAGKQNKSIDSSQAERERTPGSGAEQQTGGSAAKQDAWLKSHNLVFPFKEHLPKVVAILSPLLAGPLGELLNFFK